MDAAPKNQLIRKFFYMAECGIKRSDHELFIILLFLALAIDTFIPLGISGLLLMQNHRLAILERQDKYR